jgi:hypothetical protein
MQGAEGKTSKSKKWGTEGGKIMGKEKEREED